MSMTAAERALELIGSDPRVALEHAERAAVDAQATNCAADLVTAHRAAGLALRELGELAAAEDRLRQAIRVDAAGRVSRRFEQGVGRDTARAVAEARMSLAFILLDRGRIRAALRQADRAAVALRGLPATRLATQRALFLQRAGRLDDFSRRRLRARVLAVAGLA